MISLWIEGMMPIQLLLFLTLIFFCFVLGNYILKKIVGKGISTLWQAVLIWVIAYCFFKFAIYPPIPSSLFYNYMGLISIVLFLLISSLEQSWLEFKRPIINTLLGETSTYRRIQTVSFVVIPFLVGFGIYHYLKLQFEEQFAEPIQLRTVHPAHPGSIEVHGETFLLNKVTNPFRVDEEEGFYTNKVQIKYENANPFDPNSPPYMQAVKEGGKIFFQNCHFCHGANLNGRGMFAFAFNPIPVNLTDPGSLLSYGETFFFWRVSKGGPGLPREGFPWSSAMPPWEDHLKTDEIWEVILFEYWHTGALPYIMSDSESEMRDRYIERNHKKVSQF